MDIVEELHKVGELQGDTYSSYEILGIVKQVHAEIEQLRAEIEQAEDFIPRKFAGLREQNERLRAALKSCPCPSGGWNGMPENVEPTVENCMKHDACGCVYGDALRIGG